MLDAFGLTEQQQTLYELLLTRPLVSSDDVADLVTANDWDLPVGATLRHLQSLGLLARIPADPPQWAVVDPETALDALLLARAQVLATARRRVTELTTRFHGRHCQRDPLDLVEVVYGQQAIIDQFAQLQRDAPSEVCATDVPPYASVKSDEENHPVNTLELDLLRQGIKYRVLYDPSGLDRPGRLADLEAGIAAGEQARVADVPVKMLMSDAPLAFLQLHRRPTDFASALRLEESTLLEAMRELFEMYWQRAIPLRVRDGQPELEGTTGPTAADRRLLPLLVGGLSDIAIARQLGWTERTVRRHMQALMIKLNVDTRFQAGYQAVQAGWLDDGTNTDEVADAG